MKNEKVEEHQCTHHFEYVKREQVWAGPSGTANINEVDVVICTKCGLVRRQ